MGRIWAIPDIHGMKHLLDKLMLDLQKNHNLDLTKDKLIFLGDMIDRGPDSYSVIAYIKDLTETYPNNVIALAGNHDLMPVMYYARGKRRDDADLWFSNGGIQTIESYQYIGLSDMSYDHILWLSKLPLRHEEPGYFFSHAPAPRDSYRLVINRGMDFTPDELVWTYHPDEWGVARDHGNGVIGVSGHMHQLSKGIMAPRFYSHHYYLDSGCGCSKKAPLVAVNIQTKEVVYAWP
jgi:predicted MPP superfamily phosphohydrolase